MTVKRDAKVADKGAKANDRQQKTEHDQEKMRREEKKRKEVSLACFVCPFVIVTGTQEASQRNRMLTV